MYELTRDDGQVITFQMLLVRDAVPQGTIRPWRAHLTNSKWGALCGLAAGDGWRVEGSHYIPNWGALLCPRCRLLLDDELAELAEQAKPPAVGRGRV